ncbi:nucleotidyltransferase family protein [Tessaracoccus flavus]|uniref:Uncharacterized protein n=1 Tax=Tessaracoccus flavus TaxID=1610493 RepID=A0A1Q2CI34_9ACTN|nr:nucleotidyltransferase family protein [Tessaracoccus flavus]AQP45771.1 hypothetical protein RPIT_13965 [Tessaracoccus flavus]SDZ11596.1 Uncharacterised nucleotidyltransferase [Tessaracoccus flavus]
MAELPTLPIPLRVHLAHATVQAIADEASADVLHIKGPAVAPALRPEGRSSADADVLIRPAHLHRLLSGLRRHGWHQVTGLHSTDLIRHSTNWYHPQLGQLDVHVRFPGIQAPAERAFDVLWRERGQQNVAGRPCVVPSVTGQRLILLLHAARSLQANAADIRAAWRTASDAERGQTLALARELQAEVALASATGDLDQYRDRPEYALWQLYAENRTTTTGFRRIAAELKAAPADLRFVRLRLGWYAAGVVVRTPQRLTADLARRPTLREVAAAYGQLVRRGRDLVVRRRPVRRDRP